MTRASIFASVLAGAVLLAPGTSQALFEDDQARKAILAERVRIDQLGRDLRGQIEAMLSRLDRLEASARGQLTLQGQIESMRQEIARLRGTLEEQTNELTNTQRQQRDQHSDFDTRLRKFEPVAVEIDGRSQSVEPAERRSFEAALAAFGSKDFRMAQLSLQSFLVQYPGSPYSATATYWLGSSQFALKDYKAAADTLLMLIGRYPDNPRVPEALLNLAYTQIELNDRRSARRTLEQLVERYPEASVTATARDRLATLPAQPPAR